MLTSATSLIDIEIETTKELMELYKNKSEILSQMHRTKLDFNKNSDSKINTTQFENLLGRQENFMKKRNFNLSNLIGFDDPFSENAIVDKNQQGDEQDYEKNQARIESLFIEKILYDEKDQNITKIDLMFVKPLTKSSSGGFMSQGILISTNNMIIKLYDVYKNLMFNISMEEHGGVKLLKGSQHNDEMYIAAVTNDNQLWEFNLTLERIERNKTYDEGIEPKPSKKEVQPANKTKALETGREDVFNRKYKNMLNIFKYVVEGKQWVNLFETTGQQNVEWKMLEHYMNRGEKFYVIADSEGFINIFERGLTFKYKIDTGEKEIIQMIKHSTTFIIVHKNDIRFPRFFKGSMSTKRWHSGMSELTNIAVDSNHNGLIYGATVSGEIIIFKTERLLHNPDQISWHVQGKLKVHSTEKSISQLTVYSLKNLLVAVKSDGRIEVFDISNVSQFLLKPIGYNIKLSFSNYILNNIGLPIVETIKTFNGDMLLFNVFNQEGKSIAVLYEWLTPVVIESKGFESMNFRFPMFIIAFLVVLAFQLFNKKNGEDGDFLSFILSWFGMGERKPRYKNKKEKQFAEIEALVKNYTKQTDELNRKLASRGK